MGYKVYLLSGRTILIKDSVAISDSTNFSAVQQSHEYILYMSIINLHITVDVSLPAPELVTCKNNYGILVGEFSASAAAPYFLRKADVPTLYPVVRFAYLYATGSLFPLKCK